MSESMVTIKSIAEQANVSVTTVSRVLRNRGEISSETRKEVMRIANQLRYRPNLAAKSIFSGRTNSIGVIMLSAWHFDARIAFGIHDELARKGYVPITLWTSSNQGEKIGDELVLKQIHQLIDRRVDGFILRPTNDAREAYISEIWERNVPLVTVDRDLLSDHGDYIGTDDASGARLAAEHLLNLGHQKFIHIAGPVTTSTGRIRREVFQKLIENAGGVCRTTVDATFGLDKKAAYEALSFSPRPTAVFAANDRIASNVYSAAKDLNLNIPTDVSVVGYGDLEFASYLNPGLTTVRQDPYQMGSAAAKIAVERVEGKLGSQPHIKKLLSTDLIVRSSTFKPKL